MISIEFAAELDITVLRGVVYRMKSRGPRTNLEVLQIGVGIQI